MDCHGSCNNKKYQPSCEPIKITMKYVWCTCKGYDRICPKCKGYGLYYINLV